jgi:hypothetical protein
MAHYRRSLGLSVILALGLALALVAFAPAARLGLVVAHAASGAPALAGDCPTSTISC